MIITITLDTNDPKEAEILRLIATRALGFNEFLEQMETYDDLWERTSDRTREVLKAWSKISDDTYRTNHQLAQELDIDMRRFHAAVANLGKWSKDTTLELLESHNRSYRLSKKFRKFLRSAKLDAPTMSPSARTTNQLHKNSICAH